jgi:hypothetical protein
VLSVLKNAEMLAIEQVMYHEFSHN